MHGEMGMMMREERERESELNHDQEQLIFARFFGLLPHLLSSLQILLYPAPSFLLILFS